MANIKTRIDSLWDTYRATRPPSVVCVNKSGERTKIRWFDALRAAIQQDESIEKFEDCTEFKGCSSYQNVLRDELREREDRG